MARIEIAPRIRCDNCRFECDQVYRTGWEKPEGWRSDEYGFDDLCKKCVTAADKAADQALAAFRMKGAA